MGIYIMLLLSLSEVQSHDVVGSPVQTCDIGVLQNGYCVYTSMSTVLHECPHDYVYEPFTAICQYIQQQSPSIICPTGYSMDIDNQCIKTTITDPTHHCAEGIVDFQMCHIHNYEDPEYVCPTGSTPTTDLGECYTANLSPGTPTCAVAGYTYENGECVQIITATAQPMGCPANCVDDGTECQCTTLYNASAECQATEIETIIGSDTVCVDIQLEDPDPFCATGYTFNATTEMCERMVSIAPTYNCDSYTGQFDQVEYFCDDTGCHCRTFEHNEPTSYTCNDPGHVYDPVTNECTIASTEPRSIQCETTDYYDPVDDECKTRQTSLVSYECVAPAVHAPGTQLCVTEAIQLVSPSCTEGSLITINGEQKCVTHTYEPVDHICPDGTELTQDHSQCVSILEAIPTQQCPASYTLDSYHSTCIKVDVVSPDHVCEDAQATYQNGSCIVTHSSTPQLTCTTGFLHDGYCWSHI